MNQHDLLQQLRDLAEPEYQKFSASLLPSIDSGKILGVRLPRLRKLAKQILKQDWESYLLHVGDSTFEEVMLHGMVIGYLNIPIESIFPYIEQYIYKIDNWSLCDSFCSGLKITKKEPDKMWDFLQSYLLDQKEYFIRFGIVMLIFYYIKEAYIDRIFKTLNRVQKDAYYVKMAVAWALSICYVKYPDQTYSYLEDTKMEACIRNKTFQKIRESKQINKDRKQKVMELKKKWEIDKDVDL